MRALTNLLLVVALVFASAMAHAQAVRVDDSASHVMGSSLKLDWSDPTPRAGSAQTLSGTVSVQVRLDVRPWKGKTVNIYKVLGSRLGPGVLVAWNSQGRLMPGQLREGTRALVYSGPITTDEIQDMLTLSVLVDGSRLTGRETLDFEFELEIQGR